jgi:hypothetical protein
MMDEIMPDSATATTPRGELRYRSRKRTRCGTAGSGNCCAEATIGTIATEISAETSMNSPGDCGLPSTSRNCAPPKPTYSTSMYTASSPPRLLRLARWLSQLSATT